MVIMDMPTNKRYSRKIHYCGKTDYISAGFLPGSKVRKRAMNLIKDNFSILYLFSGNGTYIDSKQNKYELVPGDLVLRLPGEKHSITRDDANKWLEFYITLPAFVIDLWLGMGIMSTDNTFFRLELPENISTEIDNLFNVFDFTDNLEFGIALSQIQLFLFRLMSKGKYPQQALSPYSTVMQKAYAELNKNIEDRLDMRAVAKKCGCGYESFRKIFRNETGMSLKQYRIKQRIDKACAYLTNPELEIKEIADMLGYQDTPAFIKQFKKITNQSPRNFRN